MVILKHITTLMVTSNQMTLPYEMVISKQEKDNTTIYDHSEYDILAYNKNK